MAQAALDCEHAHVGSDSYSSDEKRHRRDCRCVVQAGGIGDQDVQGALGDVHLPISALSRVSEQQTRKPVATSGCTARVTLPHTEVSGQTTNPPARTNFTSLRQMVQQRLQVRTARSCIPSPGLAGLGPSPSTSASSDTQHLLAPDRFWPWQTRRADVIVFETRVGVLVSPSSHK